MTMKRFVSLAFLPIVALAQRNVEIQRSVDITGPVIRVNTHIGATGKDSRLYASSHASCLMLILLCFSRGGRELFSLSARRCGGEVSFHGSGR